MRDNIDFRKGYQEELGKLVARQDFKNMCRDMEKMDFIAGLRSGKYQVQPNNTVLKVY